MENWKIEFNSSLSWLYLFFLLDQKEPKNQGCTDLGLRAISESLNCPELVCCLLRRSILQTSYSFAAFFHGSLNAKISEAVATNSLISHLSQFSIFLNCPQAVRALREAVWAERCSTAHKISPHPLAPSPLLEKGNNTVPSQYEFSRPLFEAGEYIPAG